MKRRGKNKTFTSLNIGSIERVMNRYLVGKDLVEDVRKLSRISETGQSTLAELAIENLEDREGIEKRLYLFARRNNLEHDFVEKLIESLSTFIWDITRMSSNSTMVIKTLKSILPHDLATLLSTCCQQHEMNLKIIRNAALMVSGRRFHDMNWRVDVEIASRSVMTTAHPRYTLKIICSSDSPSKVDAINVQSNFTNLQNFQREMQKALSELQSIHSQRLTRYIV